MCPTLLCKLLLFSHRAIEVKEHPFFKGLDWQQVYLQKYPPPLIPPRGEVNAADAFDIGSFDEEDTKGIKVSIKDAVLKYMPRLYLEIDICILDNFRNGLYILVTFSTILRLNLVQFSLVINICYTFYSF